MLWNIDKEAHSAGVHLVFQAEVHEVGSRRDQFNATEPWTRLPVLVVNSKLHSFGRVKHEQKAHLLHLIVCKLLHY